MGSVTVTSSVNVPELAVEGFVFPPAVKPPGSSKTFFLGGAGVRGLEIGGNFVKFTAIGVYLEDAALPLLADGHASGELLEESTKLFRDIVTGPFEKFTRVTMILPLTGLQYSDKVAENCVSFWKAAGVYTDAEAEAIEKFKLVFRDRTFPPASSILFTQSASGSLTIAFADHGSVPDAGVEVIENRALAEAVLDSIIGEHGVSPEAKRSLASRLAGLFLAR